MPVTTSAMIIESWSALSPTSTSSVGDAAHEKSGPVIAAGDPASKPVSVKRSAAAAPKAASGIPQPTRVTRGLNRARSSRAVASATRPFTAAPPSGRATMSQMSPWSDT